MVYWKAIPQDYFLSQIILFKSMPIGLLEAAIATLVHAIFFLPWFFGGLATGLHSRNSE